jgi:hypothetical protein
MRVKWSFLYPINICKRYSRSKSFILAKMVCGLCILQMSGYGGEGRRSRPMPAIYIRIPLQYPYVLQCTNEGIIAVAYIVHFFYYSFFLVVLSSFSYKDTFLHLKMVDFVCLSF